MAKPENNYALPCPILAKLIITGYVALITLLPSLHFSDQSIITYHDSQRLLQLVLIVMIMSYCAITRLSWSVVIDINRNLRFTYYILFGFLGVSAISALSTRSAIMELSIFAGLNFLALLIARYARYDLAFFITRFCYVLWASIGLYMLSFYVGYVTAIISKTAIVWPKPFSGFTNIRSFNQYQLWSIGLVCLPLLAFDIKKSTKIILWSGLCMWWVLLFYSGSRGVVIAWSLAITITWLVYRNLSWPFIRIQLSSMIVGLIGYYYLFMIAPKIASSSVITKSIIRTTIDDRLELWGKALRLMTDNPFLGIGPMNFPWYHNTLSHPHNSVLQIAAEWGIPATIILLSISGFALAMWLKRYNKTTLDGQSKFTNNAIMAVFFTLTVNVIYSLVDGVIVMPTSQVLMASIIGLAIALYNPNDTPKFLPANNKMSVILIPVFFVALTLWSTLPEIIQAARNNEKRFSIGYAAAGPRIWWEIK